MYQSDLDVFTKARLQEPAVAFVEPTPSRVYRWVKRVSARLTERLRSN